MSVAFRKTGLHYPVVSSPYYNTYKTVYSPKQNINPKQHKQTVCATHHALSSCLTPVTTVQYAPFRHPKRAVPHSVAAPPATRNGPFEQIAVRQTVAGKSIIAFYINRGLRFLNTIVTLILGHAKVKRLTFAAALTTFIHCNFI